MEERYLYKAKRLDNGEWVAGHLITDEQDDSKCFIAYVFGTDEDGHPHDTDAVLVDNSTICQCTGLKDKNCNMIWENDIMVAHLDDEYPEDETYQRVLWHECGFYTKEKGCEEISSIDEFDQEHFEVCGNIFENAELLESEEM